MPAAIRRILLGLLVQKKSAPEREEKRVRKSEMETWGGWVGGLIDW